MHLSLLAPELHVEFLAWLLPLRQADYLTAVDQIRFSTQPERDKIAKSQSERYGDISSVARCSRAAARAAAWDILQYSSVNRTARAIASTSILWKPLYGLIWPHFSISTERRSPVSDISAAGNIKVDWWEKVSRRASIDAAALDRLVALTKADCDQIRLAEDFCSTIGDDALNLLQDIEQMRNDTITRVLLGRRSHGESGIQSAAEPHGYWATNLTSESMFGFDPQNALPFPPGPGPLPFTMTPIPRRLGKGLSCWLSLRARAAQLRSHLLKRQAYEIWGAVARGEQVGFERCIGAFSHFLGGDLLDISRTFDRWALWVQKRCDEYTVITSKEKAFSLYLAIVGKCLNNHGIQPAEGDNYYNIENHFVHRVIDGHLPTLPMTLILVWTSVARRLGLDAHPANFPGRMIVTVTGFLPLPHNELLPTAEALPGIGFPHYIDVFNKCVLSREDLSNKLQDLGRSDPASFALHTSPASDTRMLLRAATNILVSIRRRAHLTHGFNDDVRNSKLAVCSAMSFAVAAEQVLGERTMELVSRLWNEVHGIDVSLLSLCAAQLDACAVRESDRESKAKYRDAAGSLWTSYACRLNTDHEPREVPALRVDEAKAMREGKLCRVGHVFRHKEYRYVGVILDSDLTCQPPPAIWQMEADEFRDIDRYRPFYCVVTAMGDWVYVADRNIAPLWNESVPPAEPSAGHSWPDWATEIFLMADRAPTLGRKFEGIHMIYSGDGRATLIGARGISNAALRAEYGLEEDDLEAAF